MKQDSNSSSSRNEEDSNASISLGESQQSSSSGKASKMFLAAGACYSVGRKECQILIRLKSVSRHHADIFVGLAENVTGNESSCCFAGRPAITLVTRSTAITRINEFHVAQCRKERLGDPIVDVVGSHSPEAVALKDGDVVTFGAVSLLLKWEQLTLQFDPSVISEYKDLSQRALRAGMKVRTAVADLEQKNASAESAKTAAVEPLSMPFLVISSQFTLNSTVALALASASHIVLPSWIEQATVPLSEDEASTARVPQLPDPMQHMPRDPIELQFSSKTVPVEQFLPNSQRSKMLRDLNIFWFRSTKTSDVGFRALEEIVLAAGATKLYDSNKPPCPPKGSRTLLIHDESYCLDEETKQVANKSRSVAQLFQTLLEAKLPKAAVIKMPVRKSRLLPVVSQEATAVSPREDKDEVEEERKESGAEKQQNSREVEVEDDEKDISVVQQQQSPEPAFISKSPSTKRKRSEASNDNSKRSSTPINNDDLSPSKQREKKIDVKVSSSEAPTKRRKTLRNEEEGSAAGKTVTVEKEENQRSKEQGKDESAVEVSKLDPIPRITPIISAFEVSSSSGSLPKDEAPSARKKSTGRKSESQSTMLSFAKGRSSTSSVKRKTTGRRAAATSKSRVTEDPEIEAEFDEPVDGDDHLNRAAAVPEEILAAVHAKYEEGFSPTFSTTVASTAPSPPVDDEFSPWVSASKSTENHVVDDHEDIATRKRHADALNVKSFRKQKMDLAPKTAIQSQFVTHQRKLTSAGESLLEEAKGENLEAERREEKGEALFQDESKPTKRKTTGKRTRK